eukprot:snap_masked-scaffold_6-processed-gene-2.33-mRNA-1 protein AED:0.27 eAED:0.27 QI:0/-1/0/1/-1/1/1/0/227
MVAVDLSTYDDEQVKLMEERIIVIDEKDNVIKPGSKKECHLNENISKGLLHRAFSVFLFNSKNELLLQQRAATKITFPSFWANTCCSHPLHTEEELELTDALGVKRAAIRKLEQELGIRGIDIGEFKFMTRIHYEAQEEGMWGEHEIDHVLLVKKDVDFQVNENEVQQTRYFTEKELNDFFANAEKNGDKISPWFEKICKKFLKEWWAKVRTNSFMDTNSDMTIHKV